MQKLDSQCPLSQSISKLVWGSWCNKKKKTECFDMITYISISVLKHENWHSNSIWSMSRLCLGTSLVLVILRALKYLRKCKGKNCRGAQLQRDHQVPQRMSRRLQNPKSPLKCNYNSEGFLVFAYNLSLIFCSSCLKKKKTSKAKQGEGWAWRKAWLECQRPMIWSSEPSIPFKQKRLKTNLKGENNRLFINMKKKTRNFKTKKYKMY